MSNFKIWEDKIKERRKNTPFRDFVRDITSWSPLNLYKTKGKICRYPDTPRVTNLDTKEAQNASSYFLDYDFSKGFFENFKDLFAKVPLQYILDFGNNENADFVDQSFGVKNGYLTFVSGFGVENIVYSAFCYQNSANLFNSFLVTYNCNNIYFGAGIDNSYNIFYSKYIRDSSNIWFSTNLIGCSECIFCNELQNKKYCFRNKEYEKDEYFKIKKQIGDRRDKYLENYLFISKNRPINYQSENVNGLYNIKSHNVENGYWVNNTSNSRNVINAGGDNINNFYDAFDVGVNSHDFYGVVGAGDSTKNAFCSTQLAQSSNIYYSYFLTNCSFCIGCVGLKNKSYCILNKEYSKEEWYELADKIFTQMDKEGILGDFFPGWLNPFYFNDTMAYLVDNTFTKEEVGEFGYMWRDGEIRADIPEGLEVVNIKDLHNYQGLDGNLDWKINPEIMKKVIVDEKGDYYRIVQLEYDFLMKHSLPIPEIHWRDRIRLGFKLNI